MDHFGSQVAITGDYALVATPFWDLTTFHADAGAVYSFVRSSTNWTQQQRLTASDAARGGNFGCSLATSGDYALIGARGTTLRRRNSISSAGAAYIFTQSGTNWTQQQTLTASDAVSWDRFGQAVGLSGDYAVVGADQADDSGSDSGAAYIFVRSGTSWTQQQKLTASDGAVNNKFGSQVAITGDFVLVGAPKCPNWWGGHCRTVEPAPQGVTAISSGGVYVFVRTGASWTQQNMLVAPDAAAGDAFASASARNIAASGNDVFVGASAGAGGAVYTFGYKTGTINLLWRRVQAYSTSNKLTFWSSKTVLAFWAQYPQLQPGVNISIFTDQPDVLVAMPAAMSGSSIIKLPKYSPPSYQRVVTLPYAYGLEHSTLFVAYDPCCEAGSLVSQLESQGFHNNADVVKYLNATGELSEMRVFQRNGFISGKEVTLSTLSTPYNMGAIALIAFKLPEII